MLALQGFPTLVFYPAGKDKQPVPFDGGDRSLKASARCCQRAAAAGQLLYMVEQSSRWPLGRVEL